MGEGLCSSLLELEVRLGAARHGSVALVDSGASHCFLSATVAHAAGITWDASAQLSVRLADGESRACLGLARAVTVEFLPNVAQELDFWVVPLAMDMILG